MTKGLRFAAVLVVTSFASGLLAERTSWKDQTQEELIQSVLELTNVERAKQGLHPLRLNRELTFAAEWMAKDMAQHSYVGHTDSLGRSIGERVPLFGYQNYQTIRENLAGGHESAEEVVTAWMNSPGHRASILCKKCDEIGIAFYYDPASKHRRYWVQEFGKQFK